MFVVQPDGNMDLVVEKACVWFEGILFGTERGTKRRHTPPQSPNDDLQRRGQTTKARHQAALSGCNMLHVTVQPERADGFG